MIQHIEHFAAQLQAKAFAKPPQFSHRCIPVCESWTAQNIASHVAERVKRVGIDGHAVLGVAAARVVQSLQKSRSIRYCGANWAATGNVLSLPSNKEGYVKRKASKEQHGPLLLRAKQCIASSTAASVVDNSASPPLLKIRGCAPSFWTGCSVSLSGRIFNNY